MFSLSYSKIGWILFKNTKEVLNEMHSPENVHIVGRQTYEGFKIALIQSLELPNFFFDIRLSMYWQKAFKNWFGKAKIFRIEER